ncbi:MAG: 23S rRNA (adenine(2503)-C(2))-methyltransferase RlmN [Candidatus Aureabacteria bacterium]|nr:23S rRNA (adenine(2503)-C(2))-methyltransferase RlmN [Candidatus Auribacterota bacterium]
MKLNLSVSNLQQILKTESPYRIKQAWHAFFSPHFKGWDSVLPFPKTLRLSLEEKLNSSSVSESFLIKSKDDTSVCKAFLTLYDRQKIETVLMINPKKQWTVCISTQVGCPINCVFCATGKMGFFRNLDAVEMIEQVCFWKKFLSSQSQDQIPQRISNIVLMGMGEPLLNYDHVKEAVRLMAEYALIGPNQMTLSTVGLFPQLDALLIDPGWPKVKIAISLHSADNDIRKKLVPSHHEDFFGHLKKWAFQYEKMIGSRTRPLTFELVMLQGVNDSIQEAEKLIAFLKGLHRIKVNLIPWNTAQSVSEPFKPSPYPSIVKFQEELNHKGIVATIRKSLGQDINAACGQLAG